MARDDILSKIKSAEAEAKAAVQRALEEKEQKIAAATTEAANLVKSAEIEAQDYFDKSVAKAESDVKTKKASIVSSGEKNVSSLSGSANAKLDKAVEYLLKEFMGLLHA
ncbi:MAG: ATP synthase archaeal subunit H [Methanothrix sp.]|nr:ATP synthase archaeal subunit H [Methanothrix sp.]HOU70198.1 ATP synthase archaeal subunit H [Methanothrix sp.]HQJ79226.1 ATP synthase archaeal subunit H [Methanothrix sp.]HUM81493.1 ATP synthase archaeal subunit H [Methanothrix sp.]